jgi:hypothetical protein
MQPNKPRAARPVRVVPLRPLSGAAPARTTPAPAAPAAREPLWRDLVGEVLRRERLAQDRTLKDVAEAARISMPYLSELERGRKEASSEVLAAAARALGLGLGDLLSLTRDELVRHSRPRPTARSASPTASYDGLCLAA